MLCPPVTVAVLSGRVAGRALALALACDLRLVEATATLEVAGDVAAAAALVPLTGRARALELALTARPLEAAEAVALSVALVAVPDGEGAASGDDLAAALLTHPREEAMDLLAAVRRAGTAGA